MLPDVDVVSSQESATELLGERSPKRHHVLRHVSKYLTNCTSLTGRILSIVTVEHAATSLATNTWFHAEPLHSDFQ